jgi:hypothetical protein
MNQQHPAIRFAPAVNCHIFYVVFCSRNNPKPTHFRPLEDGFLSFEISQRYRRAQKFLQGEGRIHYVAHFQR